MVNATARQLLQEEEAKDAEAYELIGQLALVGWKDGDDWLFIPDDPVCHPFRGIGWALKIANECGITLHQGTCAGDCRAQLSKENWRYPLSETVPDWVINPGIRNHLAPEEVTEICTWSNWPEIAIAKLLLHARLAGVL